MKKAAIFDLNGVLIVSPLLSDRFRDVYGVPPEKFLPALKIAMAQVRAPGAGPLYQYWKPHLDEWGIQMNEQEFLKFWFIAESANVPMVNLLRELKAKGVRLFVLSNNMSERAEYYKQNFPFLDELFEKVYYSWQTGFIKPDPRCYELVLNENALAPQDCVYFDDSKDNVAVAESMGIESYLFTGVENARELMTGKAQVL
jgi:HAD superfamily hydrolase (TIGR01509 family)